MLASLSISNICSKAERAVIHVQVLASPDLRKRYDAKGAEGVDVDFMDHAEFFNALFGSDKFDHLVGELMIAAASRHGDLNANQMKRMQVSAGNDHGSIKTVSMLFGVYQILSIW